jgi:hypothetical protein
VAAVPCRQGAGDPQQVTDSLLGLEQRLGGFEPPARVMLPRRVVKRVTRLTLRDQSM